MVIVAVLSAAMPANKGDCWRPSSSACVHCLAKKYGERTTTPKRQWAMPASILLANTPPDLDLDLVEPHADATFLERVLQRSRDGVLVLAGVREEDIRYGCR
jgi:hypothetical protein